VRIRWTRQAASDLESIRDFIARDSPSYAQRTAGQLYEAAGSLADFPASGRMVPEYGNPDIRELIRGPYRTIYHRGDDAITIMAIFHSSRPLPPEQPPMTP